MKIGQSIRMLAAAAALFAAPAMALAQAVITGPAQKTIGVAAKGAMIPSTQADS